MNLHVTNGWTAMETVPDNRRSKQTQSSVTFDQHDLPPERKSETFNDVSTCVSHWRQSKKHIFHIISTLARTVWSQEPLRNHPYCHLLFQDNETVSRDKKRKKKLKNNKWMGIICFCNPFSGYPELQWAAYNESVAAFLPVGVKGWAQNKIWGTKQWVQQRWKKLRERAELVTILRSSRQLATPFTSAAGEVTLGRTDNL